MSDSEVTAALLQLGQCAERIGQIDEREGGHFRELTDTLTRLHEQVEDLGGTVAGHSELLASLDGAAQAIAEISAHLRALLPPETDGKRYYPRPTVRWWDITDKDKQTALARLRPWVDHIYRSYFGRVAKNLGECWEEHPHCLITLDWLCELWSVMFLQPSRTAREVGEQAEFATRILPAAIQQLAAETGKCGHSLARAQHSLNGAPKR
jgi:hypothetical protein